MFNEERPFKGAIDEFKFYRKRLSDEEIKNNISYRCLHSCRECDITKSENKCIICRGDRILDE